jgi:hypothetical protein
MRTIRSSVFPVTLLGFLMLVGPALGCTIFVLTDGVRTLFFNNEDWSNPKTRIWFVPGGEGYFGCAYVGFDDGWAQGGLNSEGLAFDWVAGFDDKWKAAPDMKKVRGNSSQRMLETCSTVMEAVEFYQKHQEPSFSRSRILIADRSGASAIIGYHRGKSHVEQSRQCRGFGYGWQTLKEKLANPPEPTLRNGTEILQRCRQEGEFATKYSNIFDLHNGEIFLLLPGLKNEVKLHLATELRKGGHFYDLPEIQRQLDERLKPLSNDMKRFFMEEYKPMPDQLPEVTKRVRAMLEEAIRGQMQADHYAPALWKELSGTEKKIQNDLKKLGALERLTLVGPGEEPGKRTYRYRVDFEKAAVLQAFVFDEDDKLIFSESEGTEWK